MKGRELAGSVVVITGASSGIGAATAIECGRARDARGLSRRAAPRAWGCGRGRRGRPPAARRGIAPTDVGDEAAVRALIDGTVAAWGRARRPPSTTPASGSSRPWTRPRPAEFERIVRVNYLGAVHGAWAALPHMRRQARGHIVNVASVVGKRASPFRAAYVASKFALVGFSEALRMELLGSGDPRDVRLPDRGTRPSSTRSSRTASACPAGAARSRAPSTSRGGSCGPSGGRAPRCIHTRRRASSSSRNARRARPRSPPAPPPQPAGPRALTGATRRHVR